MPVLFSQKSFLKRITLILISFLLLFFTVFSVVTAVNAQCACVGPLGASTCNSSCGLKTGSPCTTVSDCSDIFGKIDPPKGSPTDPSYFLSRGINLVIIIMGLFMLMYLLWGAFDWVMSAGEKEKLDKARDKITQAIVGMIVAIAVLTLFNVLVGPILHLTEPGGLIFKLPNLSGPTPIP